MKISKHLSLATIFLLVLSCSKKEDPQPLQKAALSFANATPITPPSAMASSSDPNAQSATAWVGIANGMSGWTALFNAPAGSATSSTPIIASNIGARSAATQQTYLVYTWSDPTYGSISYQISEVGDKYTFEMFYKQVGSVSWLRLIYAEEKKDRSQGFMNIYDTTNPTKAVVLIGYSWTRNGDLLQFQIVDSDGGFKIVLNINTKTKAGDVSYYAGTQLQYKIVWDALGNGSWTSYNSDGTTETGTWTV
jgi:hypothetical protein